GAGIGREQMGAVRRASENDCDDHEPQRARRPQRNTNSLLCDLCALCGSCGSCLCSHWFATIFRLSRYAPNYASTNSPGAPRLFPIGSVLSMSHSAGSAEPVGQAFPRARTFPSAVFSTRSFKWYHVSAFHVNGAVAVRCV